MYLIEQILLSVLLSSDKVQGGSPKNKKEPSMKIDTQSGVYVIQVSAILLRKPGTDLKKNITASLNCEWIL